MNWSETQKRNTVWLGARVWVAHLVEHVLQTSSLPQWPGIWVRPVVIGCVSSSFFPIFLPHCDCNEGKCLEKKQLKDTVALLTSMFMSECSWNGSSVVAVSFVCLMNVSDDTVALICEFDHRWSSHIQGFLCSLMVTSLRLLSVNLKVTPTSDQIDVGRVLLPLSGSR